MGRPVLDDCIGQRDSTVRTGRLKQDTGQDSWGSTGQIGEDGQNMREKNRTPEAGGP